MENVTPPQPKTVELTMTRIPKTHVKALKELSEKWNTTTHDALRYLIDLGWSGYIAPEKSAKEIAARREGLTK